MKKITLTLFFILIAGCSSTGIVKTGGDRYIVSKTSLQVGFGAPTAVFGEISQEAEGFCAKQSKEMEIVKSDMKLPALGSPGSATLEFRCKEKGE